MDSVALTLADAVEHEDTFVFLGSEAWGRHYEILEGNRGERIRGSLVLEPMTYKVDFGFKNFVQSWRLSDTEANVWLRKYWESYFDCNLPRGFYNIHHTSCTGTPPYFSSTALKELGDNPLVMHTTVATIAAGMAVKGMIGNVTRKPDGMLPLDPVRLTEKIRQVTLMSSDGEPFKPFRSTGNGNSGFTVYNVHQLASGSYSYVKVRDFTS
ncbi:metabotropic glutamate receptor-like protein [Elysia marginata]|uniref:Metabotropic glutamate receptor-like protein n=1 Tax=Elysia marginata TaxID=1093978 RepID=A0AAV4EMD2_9GAST|nr:metabotropic glutamate receptor-like protein [Elysia marginata]